MLINTIQEHLSKRIESGQLSNEDIVQLIEHIGAYLNLKTLPQWAADNNKSYNGAKLQKNKIQIFGVKFIMDNE
jgi:hypothetical protein